MSTFRIALANIPFPATPEESIALAEQAIAQASLERADLICFPECFVPGYRGLGKWCLRPMRRFSSGPGPPSQRLRRRQTSRLFSVRNDSSMALC